MAESKKDEDKNLTPLIIYFSWRNKTISLEQIYAYEPIERSGDWDENKRNYFIDRGGVKYLFQIDYSKLENSWGVEIGLEDDMGKMIGANFLKARKVIDVDPEMTFSGNDHNYIKEIHFADVKKVDLK